MLTVPWSDEWHLPLALFNAAGLERALHGAGFAVERFGVANPLTALGESLEAIGAFPEAEAQLTALELALCERPGLRDAGEHLIAVARKTG